MVERKESTPLKQGTVFQRIFEIPQIAYCVEVISTWFLLPFMRMPEGEAMVGLPLRKYLVLANAFSLPKSKHFEAHDGAPNEQHSEH
jgi:hypothetical protein